MKSIRTTLSIPFGYLGWALVLTGACILYLAAWVAGDL